MSKTNYPIINTTWYEVKRNTQVIADKLIKEDKKIDVIVPIIRGGMPIAMLLSTMLGVEEMACIHIRRSADDKPNTEFKQPINKGITNVEKIKGANVLIVDDTLDSTVTLNYAIELLKKYEPKSITVAILYNFNKETFKVVYSGLEMEEHKWIIFPWEKIVKGGF